MLWIVTIIFMYHFTNLVMFSSMAQFEGHPRTQVWYLFWWEIWWWFIVQWTRVHLPHSWYWQEWDLHYESRRGADLLPPPSNICCSSLLQSFYFLSRLRKIMVYIWLTLVTLSYYELVMNYYPLVIKNRFELRTRNVWFLWARWIFCFQLHTLAFCFWTTVKHLYSSQDQMKFEDDVHLIFCEDSRQYLCTSLSHSQIIC